MTTEVNAKFEELQIELMHLLISKGYDNPKFQGYADHSDLKGNSFFYEACRIDTSKLYLLKISFYNDEEKPVEIEVLKEKPIEIKVLKKDPMWYPNESK